MKLERTIDILGKVRGCNYIIKRNHETHPVFKGFVTHKIELYNIINKEPEIVFSVEKVIQPQMKDYAEEIMEELFIELLFKTYVGV